MNYSHTCYEFCYFQSLLRKLFQEMILSRVNEKVANGRKRVYNQKVKGNRKHTQRIAMLQFRPTPISS